MKIHQRFGIMYLRDLFTVDVEDKESSISIKCMPNSYSGAISTIDTIYKGFEQTYVDSKKEGRLNHFVCDFLQDENGRFHFLKISDYATDGKPVFTNDWKVSTKFTDRIRIKA